MNADDLLRSAPCRCSHPTFDELGQKRCKCVSDDDEELPPRQRNFEWVSFDGTFEHVEYTIAVNKLGIESSGRTPAFYFTHGPQDRLRLCFLACVILKWYETNATEQRKKFNVRNLKPKVCLCLFLGICLIIYFV